MNARPHSEPAVERVVIVGGGTAGWMAAAAAARFLNDGRRRITLIESDAIGTVGVGEATIPPILTFNRRLGISEADFLRETGGTFKLGIEFVGWRDGKDRYFHPFGTHGRPIEGLAFHQIWLKFRDAAGVGHLDHYSLSTLAAAAGRFAHPVADERSPLSGLAYAYHLDAGRYAALLRRHAEAGGVQRIEGQITRVERDPSGSAVAAVILSDGRRVAGDLFIDCSGFRSLLLGEAMETPFESWAHWLPCDRAIAVPGGALMPRPVATRATAHDAGWRWRIPLQHRTGNGIVYASAFLSDDAAERQLMDALDTPAMGEPRPLRFTAGRRVQQWTGNVVALGLAGGFLEPLESTSIHLIQEGISKLFALFPDRGDCTVERATFNRFMAASYEAVRDFIILHYHANARTGEFWRHLRAMPVPDTLAEKIALFRRKGRVFRYDDELFAVPSWVSVMLGQGIVPVGYDPLVDALDERRTTDALRMMRRVNEAAVSRMAPA